MTTLYLIRHGQASAGSTNYDVLSERGREQARCVGQHLDQIGVQFNAAYSGTLQRQIDTAALALGAVKAIPHTGFNEYNHEAIFERYIKQLAASDSEIGALYDDTGETIVATLPETAFRKIMITWSKDEQTTSGEGIGSADKDSGFERWLPFVNRVNDAFAHIAEKHQREDHVAVFSSGGVICTFIQGLFGLQPPLALDLNCNIYNSSISRVEAVNGRFYLREFNNVSHLQLQNDDSLITII